MPIEQFDPGTKVISGRLARIKADRERSAIRNPANEEEWLRSQLERKTRLAKARFK
jgi:hypothetical protein